MPVSLPTAGAERDRASGCHQEGETQQTKPGTEAFASRGPWARRPLCGLRAGGSLEQLQQSPERPASWASPVCRQPAVWCPVAARTDCHELVLRTEICSLPVLGPAVQNQGFGQGPTPSRSGVLCPASSFWGLRILGLWVCRRGAPAPACLHVAFSAECAQECVCVCPRGLFTRTPGKFKAHPDPL